MKKLILFPIILLLLLNGCHSTTNESSASFEPPRIVSNGEIIPADSVPFSNYDDWFLYQDRVYRNVLADGRYYVISASVDNRSEAICLLKGGLVYGQSGSVLIAAGNGKLLALDLSKTPHQWTELYSYDPEDMRFTYGFSHQSKYTVITRSNKTHLELLVIDLQKMELMVEPRAIADPQTAVYKNGTVYFTQTTAQGGVLLKATPQLTQIQTLATLETCGSFLAENQDRLVGYSRNYPPNPPSNGHTATVYFKQEPVEWVFDLENNELLDVDAAQEDFSLRRYAYSDYLLTVDETQWQISGNGRERAIPKPEGELFGFAANEQGIVFEQIGLRFLTWNHEKTPTPLRYSDACIESPLYECLL